jgi:hypothetical protein
MQARTAVEPSRFLASGDGVEGLTNTAGHVLHLDVGAVAALRAHRAVRALDPVRDTALVLGELTGGHRHPERFAPARAARPPTASPSCWGADMGHAESPRYHQPVAVAGTKEAQAPDGRFLGLRQCPRGDLNSRRPTSIQQPHRVLTCPFGVRGVARKRPISIQMRPDT